MTSAEQQIQMGEVNLEAKLIAVYDRLDRLEKRVNDQGRQTSKDCIVFEGTALKPLCKEELWKDTLKRVVRSGWGLFLLDSEIKQATLYKKGKLGDKDKYRMVAKFNQCWEGSNFYKILTRPPVKPKGESLWRSLHLVTANDHRLDFIARQMKKHGEIKSFIWHYVSGRLKVTYPDDCPRDNKRETFSEADDLLDRCSERLKGEIAAKDKAARSRRERKSQ